MHRRNFLLTAAGLALAGPAQAQGFSRIRARMIGAGPDVIFLPGLMCSEEVWAATAARLAGRNRVHLGTVAGFAGVPAGPNAEGAIIAPLAEELAANIRAFGLKSPTIVGHSIGGLTGLLLAANHPDLVGRLMVVDALPFYPLIFNPNVTLEQVRPQAAAMRDGLVAMSAAVFEAQQRQGVRNMAKGEAEREKILAWTLASDRSVGARAMHEAMTTDARPLLPKIKAKTTVLYAYDPAMGVPAGNLDAMYGAAYAGLPGRTLKRVDGSYHFIMYDQPDAFARELDALLA